MKKGKKILLIVLACLAALVVLFCVFCGVMYYQLKNATRSYDFPEEEFIQIGFQYNVDKVWKEDPGKRLGRKTTEPGYVVSSVFRLEGLDTDEYLYYNHYSWTSDAGHLAIRKGVEEPISRYPLREMEYYTSSSTKGKLCSLTDIHLLPAFCDGTPYDQGADTPGRFSHKQSVDLYFDLPCNLFYRCTIAQEAETGSLYFLYALIDWEAEVPELPPGETMDWPTRTYICEVTDLLADRIPEDFWE